MVHRNYEHSLQPKETEIKTDSLVISDTDIRTEAAQIRVSDAMTMTDSEIESETAGTDIEAISLLMQNSSIASIGGYYSGTMEFAPR